MSDTVNAMFNALIGEVLRSIAADDPKLAAGWLALMEQSGGWWITPPTDGHWRDVLVGGPGGDRFAQLAPHPSPGHFLVRVVMSGLTRELELALVDDGNG